jgi:hypothetical protein
MVVHALLSPQARNKAFDLISKPEEASLAPTTDFDSLFARTTPGAVKQGVSTANPLRGAPTQLHPGKMFSACSSLSYSKQGRGERRRETAQDASKG